MGCLMIVIAGLFPRLALFIVWVARPSMVDAAFDTWIWPFLGFLFLPFATLMYVILWRAGGLDGLDWFWIVVAALLDVTHWGASASRGRGAPGYPARAA